MATLLYSKRPGDQVHASAYLCAASSTGLIIINRRSTSNPNHMRAMCTCTSRRSILTPRGWSNPIMFWSPSFSTARLRCSHSWTRTRLGWPSLWYGLEERSSYRLHRGQSPVYVSIFFFFFFFAKLIHLGLLPAQIRANALSGDCRWTRELDRHIWSFAGQRQMCARRRAALSLSQHPSLRDRFADEGSAREAAGKVIDEVWESCWNDSRPFDEIYWSYVDSIYIYNFFWSHFASSTSRGIFGHAHQAGISLPFLYVQPAEKKTPRARNPDSWPVGLESGGTISRVSQAETLSVFAVRWNCYAICVVDL